MVDFRALMNRTPEERKASRKALEDRLEAVHNRNKLMVNKLWDQMAQGLIENDFAESFIVSVRSRVDAGITLTDKQQNKLEELFERY